ncbi:hypothetical protein FGO68_gene1427 [Halteria grandinella]|uniref:Uncharacterized protein n=1 Tax=Halteria grandinella TaxID=5974 RepID=A0A8J8T7R9_HALGN|nr:hypothetical protein FGO68_gene1427 [Halteria grandinella]
MTPLAVSSVILSKNPSFPVISASLSGQVSASSSRIFLSFSFASRKSLTSIIIYGPLCSWQYLRSTSTAWFVTSPDIKRILFSRMQVINWLPIEKNLIIYYKLESGLQIYSFKHESLIFIQYEQQPSPPADPSLDLAALPAVPAAHLKPAGDPQYRDGDQCECAGDTRVAGQPIDTGWRALIQGQERVYAR